MVLIEELEREYLTSKSTQKRRFGMYKCRCGNIVKKRIDSIKSGNTSACAKPGCEYSVRQYHGKTHSSIYNVLGLMIQRTTNPNNPRYDDWGGRGIKVCDEWTNNRLSFIEWALANGYQKGLSIDRIDNDGNYEPSNCRWATSIEQNNNKRNNL